jgi:hypothetical protein
MECKMNIKFCVAAVIALSAAVFAADEVVPAEAPVAATEESVAEEQAPATSAPAAVEAAAPAAEEPAAPPAVAETPAEPVQEPAPEAVSSPVVEGDEVPAPMAVRGVPADAPAGYPYAEQPQSAAAPARHKLEPVPMAFSAGVQAFVGMSNLYDNNWSLTESYDGAEWKAGAFVLIPLNEYTMGFRLGAFYSRSETSASYAYSSDYSKEAHLKFKQDRVDVPLLFVLKPSYSRFMIDLGAQVSFPVRDVFKYSYEKSNGEQVSKKADMIDLDYRASMDFALVFGFSIRANQYISFDLRTDCGFSNSYEGVPGWRINDLSRTSLLLGLSIYAF